MSAETSQNYGNHVRFDKKVTVVMLLSLLTIILGGVSFFTGKPNMLAIAVFISGFASFGAVLTARLYCVGLQDRIIRTEMKIRLRDVLDSDLASRAETLGNSQLIALRFGSDAELPGLVSKVLDENINDLKTIKQMITDWQADYHRV